MPVFALYNLDDAGTTAADSALGNGAQQGIYLNGATSVGGQAVLDGVNDLVKIYPDPTFQLPRGTLEIQFTTGDAAISAPQTVLSRDSVGVTEGGYRLQVMPDGSIQILHEDTSGSVSFGTPAGFYAPGDEVNVTYSWDENGVGRLEITNLTQGTTFADDVPEGLTMDMSDSGQNQPWMIGAGQASSNPGQLDNIDQYFAGSVEFFSLSDSVDNLDAPPVANPDSAETDEDTPVVIDVLGNDTDPEGQPLTVTGTPTAPNGTVTVNPDGTLEYTPAPDFNGTDTITYTITDPDGNEATSTVTVTVNPVNDAPVAEDDASTTPVNTPVTFAVLGNDSDVDGDPLSVISVGTTPDGTVAINPDGTLTFTPNAGFTGVTSVDYTITDPEGLTDTATWTITITDDRPVANPDSAETDEDTPVVIDVLGNDTDPEGQPLTVTGTPTAPNGTVTVNPDGTLEYTPDPDFNGTDTITYTITDPDGNEATSTVTVTVNPVNDAPVAEDDASTTPVNTPVTFAVLGNDSDVDGDPLSVISVGTTPDGTVAINPDGTLTFTPNAGFTGVTSVDYTITDPEGLTDTATWTITVEASPPPPPPPPPVSDGYVDGTPGGDLIDVGYTGDPDGDFIDNDDAILPGDSGNDDHVRAGDGNDTILSGDGDDTVDAGAGDDLVDTGEGDDTVGGGRGNDTIATGDGNDLVYGGAGEDVIDTSGGVPLPNRDYPGLYPADTAPTDDEDTVYGSGGSDTITTGDDNDVIFGGGGGDLIDGGIDDDTIFGGTGSDTIIGGEGADVIDGGDDGDLIYGGLDPSFPDEINIPDATDLRPDNGTDTIFGGGGDDTIFGLDDDDVIDGGDGNDLLDGGIDEDTITGGTGNDTITGGLGLDSLAGGDDRDTFIVNAPEDGIGDVIDGNEGGDDFDTLDLRGAGPLRIDYDPLNVENGTVNFLDPDGNVTGSLVFTNIENVIPCFTPGTLIATPRGEVPVENLKPGDRVITRDNGIQEIRWTGHKAMTWRDLTANPHLKPILIRQGSLGNGLPERDTMVSPNHRILVANDRTALYFDEHEVLVAAKHLVAGRGVQEVDSVGTTYIHFMFDRHEVVLSNGAWTESFQPGDYTLKGMGNAQRNEIFELFPELQTREGLDGYAAARKTLKKHEARLLIK
ncbi:tandem-95 repeat protein [Aliigemmobacter aestuarii]|uniref:Tandem-95 repeat protein n=1 Tax=Aliigemmobacter aestuarii TaxID=1445661 RepID=A0A4S3MPH2_9RHOB|nr:tandem-95 repeat protein [Gemmobacter aestuarii]THD84247.1 tandem-95 repeat protein [Gemmobacter aestuarii]